MFSRHKIINIKCNKAIYRYSLPSNSVLASAMLQHCPNLSLDLKLERSEVEFLMLSRLSARAAGIVFGWAVKVISWRALLIRLQRNLRSVAALLLAVRLTHSLTLAERRFPYNLLPLSSRGERRPPVIESPLANLSNPDRRHPQKDLRNQRIILWMYLGELLKSKTTHNDRCNTLFEKGEEKLVSWNWSYNLSRDTFKRTNN